MSMDECVQTVKLPESMQTKDLQEFYGMVEWAVKSVYTGYVGWFDGNPVHLLPVSEQEYNQTLLDLIGEDKLLEKIKDCMNNEQYQLALQLLELTNHQELKKECLLKRAKQVTSANARHYYITCAKE
jgi:alkyl sulfatase BDS1-like metallo-beta-lactamase superfamily hydrolase